VTGTPEPQISAPAPVVAQASSPEETYAPPRGAFFFVVLMFLFFIGYWVINWIEIFMLRS